jgi:hypothetical protein
MYTLAVAAMGRHVKAVDADFKNHAFIRSANTLKGLNHEMDIFVEGLMKEERKLDFHETKWYLECVFTSKVTVIENALV